MDRSNDYSLRPSSSTRCPQLTRISDQHSFGEWKYATSFEDWNKTAECLLEREEVTANTSILVKLGVVTVPGKPGDDLAPGTLNSVLKQAGLK
jgi:hypothetical protein